MPSPLEHPVIIVHSLESASEALRASLDAHIPITLQNAASAIPYAGVGYLYTLLRTALEKTPGGRAEIVFDAGDNALAVLDVLQLGCKKIRVSSDSPFLNILEQNANAHGAAIITVPPVNFFELKESLNKKNAYQICFRWLKQQIIAPPLRGSR